MNLLEYADGVGLVKKGGTGVGTCGDHATQPDDGATASPVPSYYDDVWTPRVLWFVRDVSTGTTVAPGPWAANTSGTGATTQGTTEDAHSGYFAAKSGTTATGRAGRIYAPSITFDTAGHLWRYDALIRTPTLSTSAQEYSVTAGFTDAPSSTNAIDGAYVTINSVNNTSFLCNVTANTTTTQTSSGIVMSAATWYRIVIDVSDVTSVKFYIFALGSAFPSSPTVTITTNIPTGVARCTAGGTFILASVGTTTKELDIWYSQISQDRLAA